MSTSRRNQAEKLCNIGMQAHLDQNHEDALDAFTRAITIDPSYIAAHYYRGVTYQAVKMDAQALREFQTTARHSPALKLKALYRMAVIYINSKRFSAAIASITQYIDLHPNNSRAYYLRANAQLSLNRFEEALSDYNHAIRLKPDNYKLYVNRGMTYKKMENLPAAIADWTHAAQLAPNQPFAYYNRSLAYHEINRLNEAVQDATQSILCELHFYKANERKEHAFSSITNFPDGLAIPLLKSCLDETSPLGQIFWEQRGLTTPGTDKGMLRQVIDELRDRHAQFVVFESIDALTSGASPWYRLFPRPRQNDQRPDACNDVFDHTVYSL